MIASYRFAAILTSQSILSHSHSRRRLSVSKPARDPRDEAPPATPATERSPSPVIDFDGLSRPSESHLYPPQNPAANSASKAGEPASGLKKPERRKLRGLKK